MNSLVPYPSARTPARRVWHSHSGTNPITSSSTFHTSNPILASMPWGLHRFQHAGDVHFITFSCYRRQPFLRFPSARTLIESTLERIRQWYGISINGYVVMPEHVHLLLHEPERKSLSIAIQMLKQISGKKLGVHQYRNFWQRRYYDRNVRSAREFDAVLHYIHFNPVKRGLCSRPEDWQWSSFLHCATGVEGLVEIESLWTARRREKMGLPPIQKIRSPKSFPC